MAEYPEGFIGGWMQAGDYLSRQAKAKVDLQEQEVKLAGAQDELSSHRKMVDLATKTLSSVNKAPGTLGSDVADTLMIYADAAVQAGRPEQALEITEKLAKTQLDSANAAEKANTVMSERLATFGTELTVANVKDDAGWKNFWRGMLIRHPEIAQNPQGYQQIMSMATKPYSPELVQSIQDTLSARKAQADLDLKKAQTARDEAIEKKTRFETDVVEPARAAELLARANSHGKVGSTAGKAASKDEQDVATALLSSKFTVDSKNADTVKVKAMALADRANEIMRAEGKSFSSALQAAYTEMRDNKGFKELAPKKGVTGTVSNPLEVPITSSLPGGFGTKSLDKSKLIPNKVYRAPATNIYGLPNPNAGQLRRWNGSVFLAVDPGEDE